MQAQDDRLEHKEVKLLDCEEELLAAGDELVDRRGKQRWRGCLWASEEMKGPGDDRRSGVNEGCVEEGRVDDRLVDGGRGGAIWMDGYDRHG